MGELRQWLDAYGITPKGQQDRRWQRPALPKPVLRSPPQLPRLRAIAEVESGDDHLRVTDERPSVKERLAAIQAADERRAARERSGARE